MLILVCGDPLSQVSPSMFSSGAQQEATPRILVLVLSRIPKMRDNNAKGALASGSGEKSDRFCFLAREPYRNEKIFIKDSLLQQRAQIRGRELSWEAEPPAETQLGYHSLCHSHNLKQRDRIGLSINLSNTVAGSQQPGQQSNVSFQSSIFNIQNHQAANSSLSLFKVKMS